MDKTVTITGGLIATTLAMIGAIIASTACATWYIRNDRLEQLKYELETLKAAKDWKLPETLRSLNEVSDRVRLETAERKELESLRLESKSLEAAIARSEQLAATVRSCVNEGTTFDLAEGQSKELAKNGPLAGVNSLTSSSAYVNIDGNSSLLTVGDRRQVKYGNLTCALRLTEIKKSAQAQKATFSLSCLTDDKKSP